MLHPHEQEEYDFSVCTAGRFDGFDRGDGPEQWAEEERCRNEYDEREWERSDERQRERAEARERMEDTAEERRFLRECNAEARAKKQQELARAIRAVEEQARILAKHTPKFTRVRALTIEDTLRGDPINLIA